MSKSSRLALVCGLFALGWVAHDTLGEFRPAWSQTGPASTRSYKQAVDTMSGNLKTIVENIDGVADDDFATLVIPQLQGTIDLAKTVIQYGNNSDVKARAEAMIAQSEKDMSWFRTWLASGR